MSNNGVLTRRPTARTGDTLRVPAVRGRLDYPTSVCGSAAGGKSALTVGNSSGNGSVNATFGGLSHGDPLHVVRCLAASAIEWLNVVHHETAAGALHRFRR